MGITAQELATMQAEAEAFLPDTCIIQTATQTNTKGSVTTTYADTYPIVACRLAGTNRVAAEKELGAALAAVSDYILTVKHDQDVAPGHRVVHNGVSYEVTAPANTNASWRTVRRVYLKLIS